MDAVNFPDGNPDADPNAHFPDDLFYVARKSSENAIFVELELAVSYDVIGVNLPRRQVIAGTCLWVYRSPDCGYAGPPVETIDGLPTSDINLDRCRKTLAACKARFGQNNPLNTSAFPASSLIGGG
jgi:lambda family phage minor tail protein L